MRTTQIRQQLHDYIDIAEDKKLKAIYTLLEDDLSDDYKLSTAQKAVLDKRYHDQQNGIGKTFSWDETVAIAEKALSQTIGHPVMLSLSRTIEAKKDSYYTFPKIFKDESIFKEFRLLYLLVFMVLHLRSLANGRFSSGAMLKVWDF